MMLSHGKAATGKLLVQLQVRKSTADGDGAREFFTNLTTPPPGWEGEIRNLVLKKKQVRGCLILYLQITIKRAWIAQNGFCPTKYFHRQR
jgi:hypothetical protein